MARATINTVFTPRNHQVNDEIYAPREKLERSLFDNITGSRHCILFGESGNGKSWLYKKVFADHGIHFRTVNCAHVKANGSLRKTLQLRILPDGTRTKKSVSNTETGGIDVVLAKGEMSQTTDFELTTTDMTLRAFEHLARTNKSKYNPVIVIENVERILDDTDYMDELANLILLIDDEVFGPLNVRFLIVGIPDDIISLFHSSEIRGGIKNRTVQLAKVQSFNRSDTEGIIIRGFIRLLEVQLLSEQIGMITDWVQYISLGIAQHVHEVCLALARAIRDNKWSFSDQLLDDVQTAWFTDGYADAYTAVTSSLNKNSTKIGRRNQVLFAISSIDNISFSAKQVEDRVLRYFSKSCDGKKITVIGELSRLTTGSTPILSKREETKTYRVLNPRYLMLLRSLLHYDSNTQDIRVGAG